MTLIGSASIGGSEDESLRDFGEDGIFLIEITKCDIESQEVSTLYFSTGVGYTTGPDDNPADTCYEPRVEQAIDTARSAFSQGATSGRTQVSSGDLRLRNNDGALDILLRAAVDGRDVLVLYGPRTGRRDSDFETVFVGTMEPADFDNLSVTIKLRDRQAELELPIQNVQYAGTNVLPDGLEGVAGDIKGKPKPLVWGGPVSQVPITMVNTTKLIGQVSSIPIESLNALYDAGTELECEGFYADAIELQNDALQPLPGKYKVWLGGGLLRFGSSPNGTPTADVTESTSSAAQLFKKVLLYMGKDESAIVANDLLVLHALDPAPCGFFVGSETRCVDLLDRIAGTVGAWWGLSTLGQYRIKRLDAPEAPAVISFEANDILPTIRRLPTTDKRRGVPYARIVLRWGQNYTVQSNLTSAIPDALRSVLSTQWREAVAEDTAISAVHLLASVLIVETYYVYEADALREAQRRLLLHGVQRHQFELTAQLNRNTIPLDLGDVVGLLHPRFELYTEGDEVGRLFVILGVSPDAQARRVTYTLWGSALDLFNISTEDEEEEFLITEDDSYLYITTE